MAEASLTFVTSVDAPRTTLLDLNDGVSITLLKGFNPGMPARRSQVTESALVDGGTFTSSVRGLRTMTVPLLLGGDAAARAETIHAIEVQLDRENVMQYRPDGAPFSVYFQTLPGEATIELEDEGVDLTRYIVTVTAQPYALGVKQTLSNVTLAANPASASGLNFTILAADVLGDVETPLNLKFADATKLGAATVQAETVVGVRRRGTVASMPFVFQCESMTQGTDTTVTANSALYSGAGSNNSTTTFATASLQIRLTATVPASVTKEARGTYRVFVKGRQTAGGTVRIMWAYEDAASSEIFSFTSSRPNALFYDLGLLTLPLGQDPVKGGPSGADLTVNTGALKFLAARDSGTASFIWDFVALVPADDSLSYVKWAPAPPATDSAEACYIDGHARRAFIGTDTRMGNYNHITSPTGFPMITPAQDNRICVLPDTNQASGLYTLTTTHTVTPYYWPRYLYIRPSTS